MSVNYIDKTTGDLIRVAGGGNDILYADAPIGSIIPFGGTTAPDGFLLCQGQAVSRTTYAELFAVIGTAFGTGDGSTTFNVPDLRGKVPVGLSSSDTEFNTLGKTGGEKTHKLVISEMPSHTHLTGISPNTAFDVELKDSGASAEVTWLQNKSNTSPTGGDGAHNNIQPYNTVNYIIKAAQVGAPADFAPVDVVENGNIKPVTSNAVYDTFNAPITDLTADETVMTYEDYTVETLGAHMYQVGGLCWVHIDIRVTYTGEVALDTDGHKDFWSNKFSIPDFDDVSEWNAVPCFGYVSNSHRRFEITLNNFGVAGGQKAIAFRLRYGEDEPIYTGDVFNLRCVCCFAKA